MQLHLCVHVYTCPRHPSTRLPIHFTSIKVRNFHLPYLETSQYTLTLLVTGENAEAILQKELRTMEQGRTMEAHMLPTDNHCKAIRQQKLFNAPKASGTNYYYFDETGGDYPLLVIYSGTNYKVNNIVATPYFSSCSSFMADSW